MTEEENPKVFQYDEGLCNESLKLIIKSALVEKFLKGDERPCNKNDFLETRKKNREKTISEIQKILHNFLSSISNKNSYSDIENELLALILILCGQNDTVRPWNTELTVQNCTIIQDQIITFFQCKSLSEFFSEYCKSTLIKVIFQILCSELTASTWKHFPASVTCFSWILEKIKQPVLSQYLQFVLPPALLLTDDYINENKITGVKCLNHIIQNITIAELQLCGHGNLIYSALIPLLRTRETELLYVTIPSLVSLTTKLEFDLKKKDLTKWSKFDDILEIFLENMELEQVIVLRTCYMSNLSLLIGAASFGTIRWSKRLLRIFREYVQTAKKCKDENAANLCLKVIEEYIHASNKLTFLYAENLLVTLMLGLHYDSSYNMEMRKQNEEIIINCINKLLKSLSVFEREQFTKKFQKKFFFNVNLKI